MKQWYEDWFNTKEYLEVYRHRNDAEARQLVDLIIGFTEPAEGGKVLDLACGAGRHSLLFARRGFHVTAVDLSDKLLAVAKKTAEENNVKINFIKSDIRHFSVDKKFDLVLNLFTSFGYFDSDEENFRLFTTAHNLLEDEGSFVFDYFNSKFLADNLVDKSEEKLNGSRLVQKRYIENNRVIKDIFIKENGDERHYKESVRMYGRDELVAAMENAGLRIKNILGGFNGEGFDEKKSQRIIIIARK